MADYRLNQPGATIQEAIDIAPEIHGDLADEIAAREAADALLATKTELQSEASARQAADAEKASITQLTGETSRAQAAESALGGRIDAIDAKIPSEASSSNQLADKNFVNSSIGTSTATYISNNGYPFTSVAQLNAYTGPHDNNDYAFVVSTVAAGNTVYSRYKYNGSTWAKEYDLNDSSFTSAQWAAINSLMTSAKTQKLDALPTASELATLFSGKQDVIADLATIRAQAAAAYVKPSGGIPKTDLASGVQTSLNKADSAIQDVSNKAEKDTDAVVGNVAEFDASHNPVDSGIPAGNVAQKDGFYSTLVAGASQNLVGRGTVEAGVNFRATGGDADLGSGTAQIARIKGKTVVWNQKTMKGGTNLSKTESGVTITDNRDGSYTVQTDNGGATEEVYLNLPSTVPYVANHKILIKGCPAGGSTSTYFYFAFAGYNAARETGNGLIFDYNSSFTKASRIYVESGTIITNAITFRPILIDLTLMFGAGNEPSTVAEFEALYPLPYYDYNAGTLVNNAATGLKTVGFNLYNPETGKAQILGGQTNGYQITGAYTALSFTGVSGTTSTITPDSNGAFNVTENGELTVTGGNESSTCIHLVWSGYRNGEHEAYWESQLALPITTITGKKSGDTESSIIFPDGMMSAGTTFDEITMTKAVKRTRSVNLGTLSWNYNSTYGGFVTSAGQLTGVKSKYQGICSRYKFDGSYDRVTDKECGFIYNTQFIVKDSSYGTDAAAFKTAMSGVYLVYELNTPLEYTLDEPLALGYRADDFGVEAKLPADTASAVSAPLRYDVQYTMNAVDTIRRLPVNYMSKESMQSFLTALGTAMNGTWSMAYNDENGQYTFTFTPNE